MFPNSHSAKSSSSVNVGEEVDTLNAMTERSVMMAVTPTMVAANRTLSFSIVELFTRTSTCLATTGQNERAVSGLFT